MPAPLRPLAVVFDVNETLTDLSAVGVLFANLGLDPGSVPWWFAVTLRDGMALAAAGDVGSFGDLAAAALDEVAALSGRRLPVDAGPLLQDALRGVPVLPEVRPALEQLAAAQVPAYALTNGAGRSARQVLEAGGVAGLLADVLSADHVGSWKPGPQPYRHAASVAVVPTARLAMVAVHPWDLHGASAAGLETGWVDRVGRPYPAVFTPPTVRARSLPGVVDGLLALPAG